MARDVKRVCNECKSNRTLVGEGIYEVRDCRGNTFALVGSCCWDKIQRLVNQLSNKYGGYVDENGTHLASPRGTPNIRSIQHLREELGLSPQNRSAALG